MLEFVQETRNFLTRLTQWKITNWLQSKITDTTVNLAGEGKELKTRCFESKHIIFIGSNLCVLSLVRMNPACILRKCLVFPSLQFLPVSTIYILFNTCTNLPHIAHFFSYPVVPLFCSACISSHGSLVASLPMPFPNSRYDSASIRGIRRSHSQLWLCSAIDILWHSNAR